MAMHFDTSLDDIRAGRISGANLLQVEKRSFSHCLHSRYEK